MKKITIFITSLIAFFITTLTLIPSKLLVPIKRIIHIKNGHILAYTVFSFFFVLTLEANCNKTIRSKILLTILYASLLGAILEVFQTFTATRGGHIKDIYINLKGIIAGIAIYLIIIAIKRIQKRITC